MDNLWVAIITPVATVVANAIYLTFVKRDLDQKVERYKIAYSGIFKEKLDLYKQLLDTMDDLKDKVVRYGHAGDRSGITPEEIMTDINKFIRFNQHGSIFYTSNIERIVSDTVKDLQEVFDLSFKRQYYATHRITNDEFEPYLIKLRDLTDGSKYNRIKKELLSNIRKDFGIQS